MVRNSGAEHPGRRLERMQRMERIQRTLLPVPADERDRGSVLARGGTAPGELRTHARCTARKISVADAAFDGRARSASSVASGRPPWFLVACRAHEPLRQGAPWY